MAFRFDFRKKNLEMSFRFRNELKKIKECLLEAEDQKELFLFNLSLAKLNCQVQLVLSQIQSEKNSYGQSLPMYLNLKINSFLKPRERLHSQCVCRDWLKAQTFNLHHQVFVKLPTHIFPAPSGEEILVEALKSYKISNFQNLLYFQGQFYDSQLVLQKSYPILPYDRIETNSQEICAYNVENDKFTMLDFNFEMTFAFTFHDHTRSYVISDQHIYIGRENRIVVYNFEGKLFRSWESSARVMAMCISQPRKLLIVSFVEKFEIRTFSGELLKECKVHPFLYAENICVSDNYIFVGTYDHLLIYDFQGNLQMKQKHFFKKIRNLSYLHPYLYCSCFGSVVRYQLKLA